jgi:hypothetical protein
MGLAVEHAWGLGIYPASVVTAKARLVDRRVVRLAGRFLKAGVTAEEQFLRTNASTLGCNRLSRAT